MNYLPLFVDTSGKKCLVVGGGNVASRKLIPILKSDMDVNLVAPEINEDICELAENYKNLILEKRKFEKKDIDNQFLVLATTNDTNINSLIAKLAKEKNILVNMAEDALTGDTLIPSVVDRNPIKIAISSGAASPILTRLVKTKLETVIPYSFSKLAEIEVRVEATEVTAMSAVVRTNGILYLLEKFQASEPMPCKPAASLEFS